MSSRPFRRKLYNIANNPLHRDIFKLYADDIEQIAADIYAHPTEDGWCCACDADVAFAESHLRESKPEIFKPAYGFEAHPFISLDNQSFKAFDGGKDE